MTTFAKRITAARKEKKLTQEQVAQAMGVSRQTVSHWENGRVEPTQEQREAVQAVAQAIAEAAPSEMDTPMLTPMVKRAMSKSIEEKGVIDVKDVAEEVFRSDPEREAIIEQVARQIQEEQLEPVIPVENKRVVAQLQRVKIKTDTGISITLPRELADDENSFAVVENGDGTISIIINKVQELKTE